MKEVIAAPQNIEPPGHAGVQSQAAEVTHATGLAVDKALSDGATANADDTLAIAGDDGLLFFASQIAVGEIIRLALERECDLTGHRILAQQTANARVIRTGRQRIKRFSRNARPQPAPPPP